MRERPRLLIEIEEYHTRPPIEDDLAFVEGLGFRAIFSKATRCSRRCRHSIPEAQHRKSREHERVNYVYNFIFLPR